MSEKDERCPKCGGYASKRYVTGGTLPNGAVIMGEALRRDCNGCGYAWTQKPLDARTAGKVVDLLGSLKRARSRPSPSHAAPKGAEE